MKSLCALVVLAAGLTVIWGMPNDFASRLLRRGAFDCNQLGEACSGIVPCCGNLKCFWEGGYQANDGVCVVCVQNNQKCQRDDQCCPGLQCDNSAVIDLQGECKPPRGRGQTCYENNQCASGSCSIKWYQTSGSCN